jgi:hypothetical protein
MKRALVRAVTVAGSLLALSAGAVGLVHLPAAKPMLRALGRVAHGKCPFGYDKPMSPAQRERQNFAFSVAHRGSARAASRPALGFVLDQTTRTEVVAALSKRGVTCVAARGLSDLTCNGVPSSALDGPPAPPRNLWLTFGTRDQLLSLIAISRAPSAETISEAFTATKLALAHDAGAPTRVDGDPSSAELSRGALRQASAEYRFSNYYALERAANLGSSFALSEEYRSLRD